MSPYEFSQLSIDQYLAFGYVPRFDVFDDPLFLLGAWSRQPRRDLTAVDPSSLIKEGVAALRAAIHESARTRDGGSDQVVLLSGGLDSRTILAGLLEIYSSKQIVAATFGLPGEEDMDYALLVAKEAGVRHEVLPTFSVEWTTQGLVDSVLARDVPVAYPFGQRFLSYVLHTRLGRDKTFWDGIEGDTLSKSDPSTESDTRNWDTVVRRFFESQLQARWEHLVSPDFSVEGLGPEGPLCQRELMPYRKQIGIAAISGCRIATRIMRDFDVRTPFLSRHWVNFMLDVPLEFRHHQVLYRQIQHRLAPDLFSIPSTRGPFRASPRSRGKVADLGRRVRERVKSIKTRESVRPSDANRAIRSSYRDPGPMRDLVAANLADLANRGAMDWTDPLQFLPEPRLGTRDDDSVIARLMGLELNLKAVDQLNSADFS